MSNFKPFPSMRVEIVVSDGDRVLRRTRNITLLSTEMISLSDTDGNSRSVDATEPEARALLAKFLRMQANEIETVPLLRDPGAHFAARYGKPA